VTQEPLPFGHRPDLVLGAALREALDPGDSGAFVARLLARAEHVRIGSWDAVLARWARVGVAAAIVFSVAAGYLVGRASAAVTARPTVTDVLIAPRSQAPVVEVVLASVLGN
jgi:hypothetical protein